MNFFTGSWICFTSGDRVGNIGVARSFFYFFHFLRFFLFGGGIICFIFSCEEERPRATRIPRGVASFITLLSTLPEAVILFFPFVSAFFLLLLLLSSIDTMTTTHTTIRRHFSLGFFFGCSGGGNIHVL